MASGVSLVILAAGKGTRMKSALPKVLHPLCGRTMLGWVLEAAATVDPDRVVLVVGHGADEVAEEAQAEAEALGLRDLQVVLQEEQNGTGHAMQIAAPALGPDPGIVLALYGDMPLIHGESLEDLIIAQREAGSRAMVVLTAEMDDPDGYGRILRNDDDALEAIVEHADATADELDICEINTGVYAFDGESLLRDLPRLETNNAQGEYYLTDLVALAVEDDHPVVTVTLDDPLEGSGVNDLAQLAAARQELQYRILSDHMEEGVRVLDPATAYVDFDVEIGQGTTLLPCVMIHSGVRIGEDCEVGPFTQLRPGTVLHDRAQVGNFTEIKNSVLGKGSKAKHLSYLGDAIIGKKTNIGCGTIFANYDGKKKHKTRVGDRVSVGSGTVFVAPNEIPDETVTAAGAVILPSAEIKEGDTWAGVPAKRKRSRS